MALDRLLAFGPHNGAHRVAVRAGISILVPLLVLLWIGHLSWAIYAAFGSFTSLYGRERKGRRRLTLQLVAGGMMVGSVTLGALVAVSPDRRWLAVPVATVVAFLVAAESTRMGWHPPGALFQIFGFASVASVPAAIGSVGTAAACAASSAALAVVLGSLGHATRRLRGAGPTLHPPRLLDRERLWEYAGLYAAGVLVAGLIATSAGIDRPYWAMVGAAVPLAARGFGLQLLRGLHRIIGTAVGLLIAWGLLELRLSGVAVLVAIAVLQGAAELMVGRNYGVALMAVTPLALLMVSMVDPAPIGPLLLDRGIETLIGAVIGILIGWAAHRSPLVKKAR